MISVTPSAIQNAFAGHLGHLTADQEETFAKFKDNLSKADLYRPPTNSHSASHDDATLLRFLRARSWQPLAAQKQFQDAEDWRKKYDVENLYAKFDPEEFESAKRFYPRWTGRRDKKGLPLYVYRLASLEPVEKELYATPPERRYQRIIVLYELMARFSLPLCTALPHPSSPTPISSTTSIIDLEGVSLGAMWRLRNHLQEASRLATANYPETLGTIAVVNSPSFFPTIWGWIKGWFDEGTRNKIHVLGKEPGPRLLEIINSEDLPKPYGGALDWKYEDEPKLDDTARELIQEMPKGPVIFEHGKVERPSALEQAVPN
ncbi:Sec14 cytosolic factor [Leucoagaricus sp. SymC.cos]|nr:Sec14 cytosolic factor [Leucoagaricus sp. SymC.cos]